MHDEHGVGDPHRPLCETESDIQQQPFPPSISTTENQSAQSNVWLNKLWPSRIAVSTGSERDRNDNA